MVVTFIVFHQVHDLPNGNFLLKLHFSGKNSGPVEVNGKSVSQEVAISFAVSLILSTLT